MTTSDAPSNSARIMIVDDHPLVRRGLAAIIQDDPSFTVVALAGNATEARQALAAEVPDLMLLDISMPGTNGLDLICSLRRKFPKLRILVLSMHDEHVYAERAIRSGAQGYIMKCSPADKIMLAIRTILGGAQYVSAEIAARLSGETGDGKPPHAGAKRVGSLSNRELQVFTFIGQGLSTRKIAEQLGLSVRTVHVHREHIKQKLGFRGAPELVHHATNWAKRDLPKARP